MLVAIELRNELSEPNTIHGHGLRVPHAMDGVPHLTQSPVPPGERFTHGFRCEDVGTFWYHPRANSPEQLGRGLAGALIVEEPAGSAPAVDRDVTWLLSDVRVGPDAAIREDFRTMRDISHAGRLGNAVTINARVPQGGLAVRAGERLRVRLINAANGRVLLGPGMRADLILDITGAPGERFAVTDSFFPRGSYRLTELAYSDAAPVRPAPLPALAVLPPNPLPEPVLDAAALRVEIAFGGDNPGDWMLHCHVPEHHAGGMGDMFRVA